jgi:hypothetical protein
MGKFTPYYDEPGDPAITRRITGQLLGKAQYDAQDRAVLAAGWVSGTLNVEVKPTVKAAAVIFGVSQPLISAALANRGTPARKGKRKTAAKTANGNGSTNGNGHNNGHGRNGDGDIPVIINKLPFTPNADDIWSHMSDDERAAFVREHAASIWSTLDQITA